MKKSVLVALMVQTTLNYLPYTSSFFEEFDLPKPYSFDVSSTRKEVEVQ